MKSDPIAPANESGIADDSFDRTIWKDRQEILQLFDISVRTLADWRKDGRLRMRKYNKKYFYHVKDAEELFKQKNKKKDWVYKWPISWPWTAFWISETIFLFASNNSFVRLFTMALPIIIVVPADIILRIRKRREKKKQEQKNLTRKQRSRRNH